MSNLNDWASEYLQQLVEAEDWGTLAALQEQIEYHNKYHTVSNFNVYPFQRKFYSAGSKYRFRFLMAGNRVGKSYSMAMEMSYHCTGLYPEWWEGKRFAKPIVAWAIGITGDTTRKVLQKELLGTPMGKDLVAIGTGSIPRDYLDLDTIERDGNIVRIVRVKHHNADGEFDGWTTLEFRSTQQGEHTLMGPAVDFIWLDEQDPYNDTAIFAQCSTRTMTTGGLVAITATPEAGRTELVDRFLTEGMGQSETMYCQNATWDDALHLTPQLQAELLEAIPVWQREMRKTGMPVVGKGIIFTVSDDDIVCDSVAINNWWSCLWALDIGTTNDPTVLTFAAHDPDEDKYYIIQQFVLDDDRSAKAAADIIKNSMAPSANVIVPHDAGDGKDGSAGYGSLLRQYGCNVVGHFHNPVDTKVGIVGITANHSNRAIAPGLHWMNDYFKKDKLKVVKGCEAFLKEKHSYHVNERGQYRGSDHCIDSARYAFMSLVANRGVPFGQCTVVGADFNNGFNDEPLSTFDGDYYQ